MIIVCKDQEDFNRLPENFITIKDDFVVNKRVYLLIQKLIELIDRETSEALKRHDVKGKVRKVGSHAWRVKG